MKTLKEVFNTSLCFLQKKDILTPKRDLEEIFTFVLGIEKSELFLHMEKVCSLSIEDKIQKYVHQRSSKRPLVYVLGQMHFYDVLLEIASSVLIPRVETEILVDLTVKKLQKESFDGKVLWDVCSGSGAIALAIKKHLPSLKVCLSDISEKAIFLAKKNARINGLDVKCFQGDLLKPFIGKKADYLICNPPYISDEEYFDLDPDVRDFEPREALLGGKSGYEFYEKLANELPTYLNPKAKIFLEIGHIQGKTILEIFSAPYWIRKKVCKDWSAKDRFFFLEME